MILRTLFLTLLLQFSFARADEPKPELSEDSDVPIYFQAKPRLGFGVRAAAYKFPVTTAVGHTIQIFGEYYLPWQSAGIFSVGAHAGVIPLFTPPVEGAPSGIQQPLYTNPIGGLQMKYQLKVWKTQPVVPIVGFEWDYMTLKTINDTNITLNTFGASYGVLLSLSSVDDFTARDAYSSLGLCNAYLSIEIQPVNLSTPDVVVNGNFWLWGLRLEFE